MIRLFFVVVDISNLCLMTSLSKVIVLCFSSVEWKVLVKYVSWHRSMGKCSRSSVKL